MHTQIHNTYNQIARVLVRLIYSVLLLKAKYTR